MRKTCPIVLPEQNSPKDAISLPSPTSSSQYAVRPAQIARTTSAVSSSTRTNALVMDFANATNIANANRLANHFGNDNYNYTEIRGGDDGNGDDGGANNEMPSTLNGIGQQLQRDRNDCDGNNQLPELSSLNTEFLDTILCTPNYPSNDASGNCETNFVHTNNSIEQDCIDSAAAAAAATTTAAVAAAANTSIAFDDSRPRQLGRRSEMRSRIVSITAEHIAEGNPVCTARYSI